MNEEAIACAIKHDWGPPMTEGIVGFARIELGFQVGGGGGHELHIVEPMLALWAGDRPLKVRVRNTVDPLSNPRTELWYNDFAELPAADDPRRPTKTGVVQSW